MNSHSREPRRQSQSVLVLQVCLALLQLSLALVETVDVVATLLGHLW